MWIYLLNNHNTEILFPSQGGINFAPKIEACKKPDLSNTWACCLQMWKLGKDKNSLKKPPHQSQWTSGKVFCESPIPSILEFYLTSYRDFLFQVKRSFLLPDRCGAFHWSEPRCYFRERRDLWAFEWEEVAGEFTLHASHSKITPRPCSPALRLNTKAFDLLPLFESEYLKKKIGIVWKVFRSLSLSPPLLSENRARWKLAPAPAPGLLGQLLRWSGLSAGSMIHFLSQHHELEPRLLDAAVIHGQICKFE